MLDEGPRDDVAVLTVRTPLHAHGEAPWTYRWRVDPRDRARARDVLENVVDALVQAAPAMDVLATHVVFGELVGNALRHAPGEIDVDLAWDATGSPVLSVIDDGPGYTRAPRASAA